MKMRREIRERWVDAMRSGDYSQTCGKLGYLGDDGTEKHCALGVLCELAADEGVTTRTAEHFNYPGARGPHYVLTYDGAGDTLPTSVRDWAGLSYHDPELWGGEDWKPVTIWNDEELMEFDQIAKLIDTDPEKGDDAEG